MRLSVSEIALIKKSVEAVFGETSIYLFGSRVDDTKIGGDVDLYLIPQVKEALFQKEMKIKPMLEDILFKPVDIVISKDKSRAIELEAMKGIKL